MIRRFENLTSAYDRVHVGVKRLKLDYYNWDVIAAEYGAVVYGLNITAG